jgi:hypothetical protein
MGYLLEDGTPSVTGYNMIGYQVSDMILLEDQSHLTGRTVSAEDGYITMEFTYPLAATFEGGPNVDPANAGYTHMTVVANRAESILHSTPFLPISAHPRMPPLST